MTSIVSHNDSVAMQDIKQPNDHDILSGRGKESYNHPGNATFRELVNLNKVGIAG